MSLDQEDAEETVGNELKAKASEGDFCSDICSTSRHKTASAGLSKGEFHGHPLRTHPIEEVDTNLNQEGGYVADDKYLCYLLWVHFRMFRTDMEDEAAVEDVVEGKKCSW